MRTLIAILACVVFALAPAVGLGGKADVGPAVDVGSLLAGERSGFTKALKGREFHFPSDHAAHPDFQTEWWYLAGNLRAGSGREFGFQLTFFRFALSPRSNRRDSVWRSSQAYMGHFAFSDIKAGRFKSSERFARAALLLAGATTQPCAVWVDAWRLECAQAEANGFNIFASQDDVTVSLRLTPMKPPVLHGEQGLSRKSAQPGNASFYYSITRLTASGYVTAAGQRFEVNGDAWMDHEWSTSALSSEQAGWDWFGLQFEDGSELMFYHLRRRDGSTDRHSAGTFTTVDGQTVSLTTDDVKLESLGAWRYDKASPVYPSTWLLSIPKLRVSLKTRPKLPDQELRHRFRYWEGAVTAVGKRDGVPMRGQGYLEMTGYGGIAAPGARAD